MQGNHHPSPAWRSSSVGSKPAPSHGKMPRTQGTNVLKVIQENTVRILLRSFPQLEGHDISLKCHNLICQDSAALQCCTWAVSSTSFPPATLNTSDQMPEEAQNHGTCSHAKAFEGAWPKDVVPNPERHPSHVSRQWHLEPVQAEQEHGIDSSHGTRNTEHHGPACLLIYHWTSVHKLPGSTSIAP